MPQGLRTALTRFRSYSDFLNRGEGSTNTLCSRRERRRFRLIEVRSEAVEAAGERCRVAAIVVFVVMGNVNES
jgi:hypothetical protein